MMKTQVDMEYSFYMSPEGREGQADITEQEGTQTGHETHKTEKLAWHGFLIYRPIIDNEPT
jgi:hypothetical protein